MSPFPGLFLVVFPKPKRNDERIASTRRHTQGAKTHTDSNKASRVVVVVVVVVVLERRSTKGSTTKTAKKGNELSAVFLEVTAGLVGR